MKKPFARKNKQTGAAIMMALFFFTIASFVVMQLSQETLTESTLSGQDIKKVKSYYSAKAAQELALLRIKAYHEAKASLDKLGKNVPPEALQQLSLIWQFPLPWPLPFPEDFSTIAKDESEKTTQESLIKNLNFFHEISDTSTKLDLNSLGSPIETISEATIENLMRSFESILREDEEFSRVHSYDTVKEALNNIADWIDEDTESRNGGGENRPYPYDDQKGYPRNQSLMAMSELLLIDKVDELIYEKLQNLGTIYSSFGINVNTANKQTLMGLDEQFTDYTTDEFIKRRTEIKNETGQDLDKNYFDSILTDLGFRGIEDIHSKGVPILFSPVSTFYVEASGVEGEIETLIKSYVINAEALKEIFITQLDKSSSSKEPDQTEDTNPAADENPADPTDTAAATPTPTAPPETASTSKVPTGRPFVIHTEIN